MQCFTCGQECSGKLIWKGKHGEYYCCAAHQAQSPILHYLAVKRQQREKEQLNKPKRFKLTPEQEEQ